MTPPPPYDSLTLSLSLSLSVSVGLGHKPTLIEELKRPDSRQHLHGQSLQRFRESKVSQPDL